MGKLETSEVARLLTEFGGLISYGPDILDQ
jgi:hypothetical protein